jgi:hypothetical protein
MILLDAPYVSDLLIETIVNENLTVIGNGFLNANLSKVGLPSYSEELAVIELNTKEYPLLYSNSENAIHWVTRYLKQTKLPEIINLFKDKVRFRKLVHDMYPEFFFKEIAFDKLSTLDLDALPFPFIIKPSVGFFSLGVHKVDSSEEWPLVLEKIHNELDQNKQQYPAEVVNHNTFIIEQLIVGDEFAFDAYFDALGNPVILGIFQHLFSSDSDVSDRVYFTSKALIEAKLESFTQFLMEVGKRAELKNFPLHVEVRIENNKVIPIEVNPMRFGGWCTTADLTTKAFAFNPYVYFQKQLKPNWESLLANKEGKKYCMVILDNSTGIESEQIAAFDFDGISQRFEKVLDLRKNDWTKYPLFGILFTETRDANFQEIVSILSSDLKEFVNLKELV